MSKVFTQPEMVTVCTAEVRISSRRWSDWTAMSEGCYLLRTNLTNVDPAALWKRYIQLTEAEWAFRITKNELEIRPIWHQREERVLAHVLVCFLNASVGSTRSTKCSEDFYLKSALALSSRPISSRNCVTWVSG